MCLKKSHRLKRLENLQDLQDLRVKKYLTHRDIDFLQEESLCLYALKIITPNGLN